MFDLKWILGIVMSTAVAIFGAGVYFKEYTNRFNAIEEKIQNTEPRIELFRKSIDETNKKTEELNAKIKDLEGKINAMPNMATISSYTKSEILKTTVIPFVWSENPLSGDKTAWMRFDYRNHPAKAPTDMGPIACGPNTSSHVTPVTNGTNFFLATCIQN